MLRGARLVELNWQRRRESVIANSTSGAVETSVTLDAQLPLDEPEMETK